MTAFTSDELDLMRADVQEMYDQTLDIYRATSSDDTYGGSGLGTPALVYSGIPCDIYSGASHIVDMPDEGQLVNTQLYNVSVPHGTDVQKDDQVVISSWGNLKLRVTVVMEPESAELEVRFIANKEVLSG